MAPPDFSTCSSDEVAHWFHNASVEEIKSLVSQLSPEQIVAGLASLEKNRSEKIRASVYGLSKRPQIEAVGKTLQLSDAMTLVDRHEKLETEQLWKLSPLFVGMPHSIFLDILSQGTPEQLKVMQHEGVTEPVQHHLTLSSNELNKQSEDLAREIEVLTQEIDDLYPTSLTSQELNLLLHRIGRIAGSYRKLLNISSHALAIAWKSNRGDLVEKLTTIKNTSEKVYREFVGSPGEKERQATGLYAYLEHRLGTVYGDTEDPDNPEALDDDTPATEALVKFSVWYLKDYWQMGLLPSVTDLHRLNLDPEKHTEAECLKRREELFSEARQNLEKLGLVTLKDLKQHRIFSRDTLKEYIAKNISIL